jgi:hypothetical protein
MMDTNKGIDLVTSENNQQPFDADKAKTFSENFFMAPNYYGGISDDNNDNFSRG